MKYNIKYTTLWFQKYTQVAQLHHVGYVSAKDDVQNQSCRIGDIWIVKNLNKYLSKPGVTSYKNIKKTLSDFKKL